MGAGGIDTAELEKQELLAKNAFDEIDEDGNGYIMIGELHGLAESLGLAVAPEEQDEALEALDGDDDGVLDREEWSKWWAKRWAANQRSQKLLGGDDGDPETSTGQVDDNSDGGSGGEGEGGGGGGERIRITRLAERARQARRRAGTDIHTAAWRGDLALVKDFLEEDPGLANAVDETEFGTGYRPLHYAAYGGFLDVCEALHAAGARALAAGDNGVTALFLAAQAGKADVVRFLLDLGVDPTAKERESGLCAVDVVGGSGPDILRLMQEKGGYEVPPPVAGPPTVTRVGPTSLQVAFLPLPEARGKLPVTRYKVKVEHDGAWPAAADGDPGHLVPEAPETDNNDRDSTTATSINKGKRMPFTPTTSAAGKQAEGAAGEAEGGGAAAAAAAAEAEVGNPSGFANPTLAQLVLVPAREASAQIATPAVEGGGPPGQQGRQRRTLVTVRGLKPRERYRVLVAAVNALGFGPYGPASAAVVTPDEPAEDDDGTTSTAKGSAVGSRSGGRITINININQKGKGRQVLAMERRRRLAAQASRLQEQQQREAEERHERQVRRSQEQRRRADARTPERMAATTGGALGAGRGTVQHRSSVRGRTNDTQPLPTVSRPQQQRHRRDRPDDGTGIDVAGAAGNADGGGGGGGGGGYEDELTESTERNQENHRPRRNGDSINSTARLAKRDARQAVTSGATKTARAAKTAPPASRGKTGSHHQLPQRSRPERARGGGPRRTIGGAGEHQSYGDASGEGYGDSGPPEARLASPRLLATAPASSTGITEAAAPAAAAPAEEPRYLAARTAGEMSARRAYHRRNNEWLVGTGEGGSLSSALGDEEARAVAALPRGSPPSSKGAVPGRQGRGGGRRGRPGGGGGGGGEGAAGRCCSSSEVSVSSCGDMTISSEEREGEEFEYAG